MFLVYNYISDLLVLNIRREQVDEDLFSSIRFSSFNINSVIGPFVSSIYCFNKAYRLDDMLQCSYLS